MMTRREFCRATGVSVAIAPWLASLETADAAPPVQETGLLPLGADRAALAMPWFPSRLHAFVWRNWGLVEPERMARVVGAGKADVIRLAHSMGLPKVRAIAAADRPRMHLTLIRRNWHLLPYEQLLGLLECSAADLAYTLREDDFFFVKLGLMKPRVGPLRWSEPDAAQEAHAAKIAGWVREAFPGGHLTGRDPLFSFVRNLSRSPSGKPHRLEPRPDGNPLRLGYSYFALYGDPMSDPALDPYPDGYLARLAAAGVNAVWLQGVLSRLASVPWDPQEGIEKRRMGLRSLTARAARHGIRVFLYLNEPRALRSDSRVFVEHPDWRGVPEHEFHAVCTSTAEVRKGLRDAITDLCRAVPDLGGFFTITASENQTNCWSHGRGAACPRCRDRTPAAVIAEVNATFHEGIVAGGGRQRLIAWDWGWADAWAEAAIARLPAGVATMSVSEWDLPIERGGVRSKVGEYCLSIDRSGPRARRHWEAARKRGLRVTAKLQLGVTWEFAAAPYLPVVENVVRHLTTLREAGVEDFMLGWTLGGHPSPNIEAVDEVARGGTLETLAVRRHGEVLGPAVARFWKACSKAFREFPYSGGTVYQAPLQTGPSNPLWPAPTGYGSTMVGIPYDDLEGWRSIYPAGVFVAQLERVARGFDEAVEALRQEVGVRGVGGVLADDLRFAEAAALHFASVAAQSRYVMARSAGDVETQRRLAREESVRAVRLHGLQSADSRIGFEASNQYFYTPLDLVEKVVNCRWMESGRD